MNVSVLSILNTIKTYFLFLLKILTRSYTFYSYLIGSFMRATLQTTGLHNAYVSRTFAHAVLCLDHSAFPTLFNGLLLILQVSSALLLPHGDIPRSSVFSNQPRPLRYKLSQNAIAFQKSFIIHSDKFTCDKEWPLCSLETVILTKVWVTIIPTICPSLSIVLHKYSPFNKYLQSK